MVGSFIPKNKKEALDLKAKYTELIPYSGGTDLMVENRKNPSYLFLGKLNELKGIKKTDGKIEIGAETTFTEALESPIIPQMMKDALILIAAPAIRNTGTFAGNIGNGSAKADSALIEYGLDAVITVESVRGERNIPIEDFYLGRKHIDLNEDEIITKITIPDIHPDFYSYEKVGGRKALAISRIAFLGILEMESDKIKSISVSFGAVSEKIIRYKDIEKTLIGLTKNEAKAKKDEFVKAYEDRMQLTEGRVSADYRKKVTIKLLKEFLKNGGI